MEDHRNPLAELPESVPSIDLESLRIISALGRGAKGVVFLAQSEDGELFALKAVLRDCVKKSKKRDHSSSEYKRLFFERDILASFHHPLLPRLRGMLSTDKIVGYAIDYCPGRDLNTHRKRQTEKMFSDDIIRFYAAEIVLALEYLHGLGIVYRDLKPENVMIQESGHLMLVDFDLSTRLPPKTSGFHRTSALSSKSDPRKKDDKLGRLLSCCGKNTSDKEAVHPWEVYPERESVEKSNSFVGTEEYMAPEVISGGGHDFAVDWWCLGVLLHEMLYGVTPFRGENRKETFYRILTRTPEIIGEPTPLRDLIRKMLEKDPEKRISVREIKSHGFFESMDWDGILELPRPPFIPAGADTAGNKQIIDVESFVEGVFEVVKVDEEVAEKENPAAECNQNQEFYIF